MFSSRVPITNKTMIQGPNSLKNAVINTGGTPASDSFLDIRNAADFTKFNTAYLNGATVLSEINSFGQFTGYPISSDSFKSLQLSAVIVNSDSVSSTFVTSITATFYDLSSGTPVSLGTASLSKASGGDSLAYHTVVNFPSGSTGSTAMAGFMGYIPNGGNIFYPSLFVDKQRIITTYGTYEIRILLTEGTGKSITIYRNLFGDTGLETKAGQYLIGMIEPVNEVYEMLSVTNPAQFDYYL